MNYNTAIPMPVAPLVATRNGVPAPLMRDELLNILPEPVRRIMNTYSYHYEKELLLLSSLAVMGGLMTNVSAEYHGKHRFPTQYLCVWGPFGTGKSGMGDAKAMAAEIHRKRRAAAKLAEEDYELQLETYKIAADRARKDPNAYTPEKPTRPHEQFVFMPENVTTAMLVQKLAHSATPAAIYFADEIDALLNNFNSEHGDFSSIMRSAFDHTTITKANVTGGEGGGKRDYEIDNPRLTFVLSGTQGQVQKLLLGRGTENGLLSRMVFYRTPVSDDFADVLTPSRRREYINYASMWLEGLVSWLGNFVINVEWTPVQAALMQKRFEHYKRTARPRFGDDYNGIVNRLGVHTARWAMILAVLDYYERHPTGQPPTTLPCPDTSFEAALEIMEINKWYLEDAFQSLAMQRPANEDIKLPPKQRDLYLALPDVFVWKQLEEVMEAIGAARGVGQRLVRNTEFIKTSGKDPNGGAIYVKNVITLHEDCEL